MKIVFNTSPLIFLSRLEFLESFLLGDQPGANQYYVPQAVVTEILAKQDAPSRSIQRIFAAQQIMVQSIASTNLANSLNQQLGIGESEAIALAIELKADYIILDDAVARREASRLGLPVKGTLAIVKKLQKDEKISLDDLDQFYQRLMEIGFRVKRSIFDEIFRA